MMSYAELVVKQKLCIAPVITLLLYITDYMKVDIQRNKQSVVNIELHGGTGFSIPCKSVHYWAPTLSILVFYLRIEISFYNCCYGFSISRITGGYPTIMKPLHLLSMHA